VNAVEEGCLMGAIAYSIQTPPMVFDQLCMHIDALGIFHFVGIYRNRF